MAIPGNLLSSTAETIDPNTSGWAPKANASLSMGIGGRTGGGGCLLVKSIAAGEAQARTFASYPVTAGTLYEAFADTSGVVPERIGIRWLNQAGTEISITWSLLTMAASSSWHRVAVAGTAPAGTVFAQVILSSTETTAGANHFWENIYLGLPIRTVGNLLPFTTESTEVDASGWMAEVNATISRQVPVVTWSVTNYTAGGHTLAMTATAAGNAAAVAVDRPGVTPGSEYITYAYLQPPTLTSVVWLELRFYDANGNQVGASHAQLAQPGTGFYRQILSGTAPASAATCGVAAGIDGAAAGQVLRLETVVIRAAPPLVAGTVLPYINGSFEQNTGGWTKTAGAATIARSTPWGAAGWAGNYSLAVSSATAGSSTVRSPAAPVPAAPGLNWRARVVTQASAGAWSSVTVKIRWYDGGGADLGVSIGTTYVVPTGAGWYLLTTDAVAPSGTVQAAVEVVAVASTTTSVLYVDAVALWQVLPLTAVEARPDDGYLALTLRELPDGQLISIYRVTSDGARTLVRGPSGLIDRQPLTSDIMVLEDHEAPLGVSFYYRIDLYTAAGVLASTRSSDPVSLTLDDVNEAWLKDPGNPQRNMRVLVEKPPDWSRPIEQSVQVVRGRRNKVVFSGRRQGLEGDLTIWTRSDAERESLHLLLDSGNTLLWQVAPGMGETDMYVAVGQTGPGRVGGTAREPWRTWTLPLTEQDMPVTTGVNGAAGRTWQDVVTEFATCADVLAVYVTSEDLLLDRRTG